jgi:hypothetical protein
VEAGEGKFAKTDGGWGIFLVEEPDEPSDVVTIFDTEVPNGVKKAFDTDNHFYRSGFQLRVRSGTWLGARKKMDQIIGKIDRVGRFDVGDVTYENVFIDGEPRFLLRDKKGRFIWIVYGMAARH